MTPKRTMNSQAAFEPDQYKQPNPHPPRMATNNTLIPARTLGAACHRKTRRDRQQQQQSGGQAVGIHERAEDPVTYYPVAKAKLAHHFRGLVSFQTHLSRCLQAAEVLGHGNMQNPAKSQAQTGPNRPGIAHSAQSEPPQIEQPHTGRKMSQHRAGQLGRDTGGGGNELPAEPKRRQEQQPAPFPGNPVQRMANRPAANTGTISR